MNNHWSPNKPTVVLDLSVIRGLGRGPLPDDFQYLIPDTILGDLADPAVSPGRDADGVRLKLRDLFRWNSRRVFVSHLWGNVSKWEIHTGRTARLPDMVDHGTTEMLIEVASDTPDEWTGTYRRLRERGHLGIYERGRSSFREIRQVWSESMRQANPELHQQAHGSPDDLKPIVRVPRLILPLAAKVGPEYTTPEVLARLNVFPDELAVGRWLRLYYWYVLNLWRGRTADADNDWDDMHYAHAASYSAAIVSNDNRLRDAVADCFPGVRVLSSIAELRNPSALS
jgi:hypothetical protein